MNENAVTVAIIEDATVLWPVDPREDAIQVFQVVVVVGDPAVRFRHAGIGIAAGHSFDSHEPHALAVQMERAVFDFEPAYTKRRGAAVSFTFAGDEKLQAVESRMVEVPEPCLGKPGGNRQRLDGRGLDCKVSSVCCDM